MTAMFKSWWHFRHLSSKCGPSYQWSGTRVGKLGADPLTQPISGPHNLTRIQYGSATSQANLSSSKTGRVVLNHTTRLDIIHLQIRFPNSNRGRIQNLFIHKMKWKVATFFFFNWLKWGKSRGENEGSRKRSLRGCYESCHHHHHLLLLLTTTTSLVHIGLTRIRCRLRLPDLFWKWVGYESGFNL